MMKTMLMFRFKVGLAIIISMICFLSQNTYSEAQTNWIKNADNPVLVTGTGFESYHVHSPTVIKEDGAYKMWYTGYRPSSACASSRNQIGYATSTDGKIWKKSPENPVIHTTPGTLSWAYSRVAEPTVIKVNGIYKMWFDGLGCSYNNRKLSIGYAYSTDGEEWTTDYYEDPVIKADQDWELNGEGIGEPTVIYDESTSTYKMWYSNRHNDIGYATSPDGINWTKHNDNPVFTDGSSPTVLNDGRRYHMWYTDSNSYPGITGTVHISYATSPDGINWTKYDNNPVVTPETPTQTWEKDQVGWPCVISDGTIYEMWFTGHGTPDSYRIGFARYKKEIIEALIDIKPGSCPNPLNTKSKGVLPVAILGTGDFDVTQIDTASIRLMGVAPLRSSVEDVATPEYNDECNDYGPDSFDDLTLKFKAQEIVNALEVVNDGDEVTLKLTGELYDGTPIEGEDVVVIKKKGKK